MYTHKHTKILLHLYTKKKQRYMKRTPLPSQYAYKYYIEIISATVKQLVIHYSNNAGLNYFIWYLQISSLLCGCPSCDLGAMLHLWTVYCVHYILVKGKKLKGQTLLPLTPAQGDNSSCMPKGRRKLTGLVSMDKSPYSFGPSWMQQKPQSKPLTVNLSINTAFITEYAELNLYHVVILLKTKKT